jgi:hypothetical protein
MTAHEMEIADLVARQISRRVMVSFSQRCARRPHLIGDDYFSCRDSTAGAFFSAAFFSSARAALNMPGTAWFPS